MCASCESVKDILRACKRSGTVWKTAWNCVKGGVEVCGRWGGMCESGMGMCKKCCGCVEGVGGVRCHSGGSMKLNACILLLAHMVYL